MEHPKAVSMCSDCCCHRIYPPCIRKLPTVLLIQTMQRQTAIVLRRFIFHLFVHPQHDPLHQLGHPHNIEVFVCDKSRFRLHTVRLPH
eukprot:1938210-Rhodomonas_salina.1